MKRLICLIITLLLIFPITVSALDLGPFSSEATCRAETIDKNLPTDTQNATAGFVLTCAVVTCNSGAISYANTRQPASLVSCANGNTNLYTEINSNPIAAENPSGGTCTTDTFNPPSGGPIFVGIRYRYDCTRVANGAAFTSGGGEGGGAGNNNPTASEGNAGTTANPQTNITTYYAVLSVAVVVLSLSLYIVNKKNVFKRM